MDGWTGVVIFNFNYKVEDMGHGQGVLIRRRLLEDRNKNEDRNKKEESPLPK